jgi:hypothetical protein
VEFTTATTCPQEADGSSLISGEDFAKISAALLNDDSASMENNPFFSRAGVQVWLAYLYVNHQHIGAQHCHCDCHLSRITEEH